MEVLGAMAQHDMSDCSGENGLRWSCWIPPAPVSPCLPGGGGGCGGVSSGALAVVGQNWASE